MLSISFGHNQIFQQDQKSERNQKIMGLQTSYISDRRSSYHYYYLCNYLPLSAGRDTLSRSLLKFKHGLQPDLDGWIDCALQLLTTVPIKKDTCIVRALHHDETVLPYSQPALPANPDNVSANPDGDSEDDLSSLDLLGKALAAHFHCHYQPGLLRKSRITRPNKGLSRQDRQKELEAVYTLLPTGHNLTPVPSFLVIDDILTTGTTARTIIRAIRHHYPQSPMAVFTLAKADHDPALNLSTPLRGHHYSLQQGAGWQVNEETTDYYSGAILRKWILANSF